MEMDYISESFRFHQFHMPIPWGVVIFELFCCRWIPPPSITKRAHEYWKSVCRVQLSTWALLCIREMHTSKCNTRMLDSIWKSIMDYTRRHLYQISYILYFTNKYIFTMRGQFFCFVSPLVQYCPQHTFIWINIKLYPERASERAFFTAGGSASALSEKPFLTCEREARFKRGVTTTCCCT